MIETHSKKSIDYKSWINDEDLKKSMQNFAKNNNNCTYKFNLVFCKLTYVE